MLLTKQELEDIKTRLIREQMGDTSVLPVTEAEIELVREEIEYEKTCMGFFNFYVSPKQAKLTNLLENHRQVVVWGGVRSTKTSWLADAVLQLASGYSPSEYEEFYTQDGQKVLKPTYKLREKPLVPLPCDIAICVLDRSLQRKPGGFEETLLAKLPQQWKKHIRRVADYTEYILLNNGSKIWFLSAESGEDKMQSAVYSVVVFDESQDEKIYKELVSRVGRRAPIVIMGFHTNRGKNWAWDLFIKNEQQGKTPEYRAVQRISILDNPFIPIETKEDVIQQWKDEGQYERRVWGAVDDLVGIVYKTFSREKHCVNASEIPEFVGGEPPKEWAIISGLDCHHTDKGCAASWIAVNPENGRCYLFHEYESQEEPAKWIKDLNEIDKKYPSRFCFADPSMDSTDNRGYNLWDEFRQYCTLPLIKANRDHAQGIQAVISALAPLRDENLEKVDDKPGLIICDHCQRTIEQLEMYHRKSGAINDVVKKDDEFCDTLRYMMVTSPGLQFMEAKKGVNRFQAFTLKGGGFLSPEPPAQKGAFIFGGNGFNTNSEKKGAFIFNTSGYGYKGEAPK